MEKQISSSKRLMKSKRELGVCMDSVKEHRRGERGGKQLDVLERARECWTLMRRYREDRERCKRYAYGDQWGDCVVVGGKKMTEGDYIKEQGSIPLKNNLIRRLVCSVIGVYRSQDKEPICVARDRKESELGEVMSCCLKYNMELNGMDELLSRTFEEFLIGGLVVHKKTYGWRNGRNDCWTDMVHPNNFFVDTSMRDPRGWDVGIIGELHDMSFGRLCENFARSRGDYERLQYIYQGGGRRYNFRGGMEFGSGEGVEDFYMPLDSSMCRVIEVWTKELKPRYRCVDYLNGEVFKVEVEDYGAVVKRENERRLAEGASVGLEEGDIPLIEGDWFMDNYWYYRYLTPYGDVLSEGETPYEHGSHPYVFKAHPFLDGEVHSFVSDVIDQQRYVNRLVTMYDWIMRSSAKGVLMIPEECIPADKTLEDFAEEWTRFDGVISFKAKAGVPLPQQVSSNATNIGIRELLSLQLQFFEDISGVHGALQGKPGNSNVSGSLYAQQAQNSTMALLDLLQSYGSFVLEGAKKDVKNIQQFYNNTRALNISGKRLQIQYDPQLIRDVDFDLSVSDSTSTQSYRKAANEFLMSIWERGQIPLKMMLEHGDFPFGDELLQSLNSLEQKMASGGGVEPLEQ